MTVINGWQCHDDFGRAELPRGLWKRLERRHGRPCLTPEVFGPQTAETLLTLRREVVDGNRQSGRSATTCSATTATISFSPSSAWCTGAGTICGTSPGRHRGSGPGYPGAAGGRPGRVLPVGGCGAGSGAQGGAAGNPGDGVRAPRHGGNDGWYEVLEQMLARISGRRRARRGCAGKGGLLYRLKRALPWTLVRQVTRRIPQAGTRRWSRSGPVACTTGPARGTSPCPWTTTATSASTSRDGSRRDRRTRGRRSRARRGGRGAPKVPGHRDRQAR